MHGPPPKEPGQGQGALSKATGWIKAKYQSAVLQRQHSAGEWLASLAASYCPSPSRLLTSSPAVAAPSVPPPQQPWPGSRKADEDGAPLSAAGLLEMELHSALSTSSTPAQHSPRAGAERAYPDPNQFWRDSRSSQPSRKSAPAAFLMDQQRADEAARPKTPTTCPEGSAAGSCGATGSPRLEVDIPARGGHQGGEGKALLGSASLQPQRTTATGEASEKKVTRGGSSRLPTCGGGSSRPELHELFQLMDLDGDGRISAEELARVLRVVGEDYSVGAVKGMIAQADSDGDGFVSLEDFATVVSRENSSSAFWARKTRKDKEDTEHKLSSTSFGSSVGILSSDSMRSAISVASEVSSIGGLGGTSFHAGRELLSRASDSLALNPGEDEAVVSDGRVEGNQKVDSGPCRSRRASVQESEGAALHGNTSDRRSRDGDEAEDRSGYDLEELRAAFEMFDCDGNGTICEEDLLDALQGIWGDDVTWEECETIILNADEDGDGVVGFDDFVAAMRGGEGCFGGAFGSRSGTFTTP